MFVLQVEVDIFDEVMICRHYVGHTHELVDGENSHIRAFMLGLSRTHTGAVVGHPDELLAAFTDTGPHSMFNRNSRRCKSADYLEHVWDFASLLEPHATAERCSVHVCVCVCI